MLEIKREEEAAEDGDGVNGCHELDINSLRALEQYN
jgi:hypothetical protein